MKGLIIISGLLSFLGALILLWVGGSMFASFRSENIMGPGVDIILLNKYPLQGEDIKLEVTARGGDKAGLEDVYAFTTDGAPAMLSETHGEGVTWGNTITGGKSRGSATVLFTVPQELALHDRSLNFDIQVNYVCAMGSSSTFNNENKQDRIPISIPIYTPGEKFKAQLIDTVLAFAGLFLWGWLWYAIWKRAENRKHALADPGKQEDVAYAIMGLLVGGSMMGYWIFARALSSAYSINNAGFTILMVMIWISSIVIAWRMAKKKLRTEEVL
jgi:hypothetical protein